MTWLRQQNNVPFDDGLYRLSISPSQYEALILDQDERNDLRYASPQILLHGEVGVLHNCRIIVTNYIPNTSEGASNAVTVQNAFLLAPRWSCLAYKHRRRFGIFTDYDVQLLRNERACLLKSA